VGPPGTFPVVSLRDVLRAQKQGRNLDDVDLEDAFVIIGTTDPAIDGHATPFSNGLRDGWQNRHDLMSGPEIHANIIATVKDQAFIKTNHWFTSWPALLVGGALLGLLYTCLNRVRGTFKFALLAIALAACLIWSWHLIARWLFQQWHWQVDVLPVSMMVLMVIVGNFVVRWYRLRSILGELKTPALVDQFEQHAHRTGMTGEERVVTVLFADIIGFTAFSERSATQDVIELLNQYFSAVYPCIERNHGILNQFAGDGMMLIFGAPVRTQTHAQDAIRAAIEMVQEVDRRRETWASLGNPQMAIAVGIHTGAAIVGTVGSPQRFDYTAIGDVTNTAARIEAKTRDLNVPILISAETYRTVPAASRSSFQSTPIAEPFQFKNKTALVHLHSVQVPAVSNDHRHPGGSEPPPPSSAT
jgi:adenylate cyclase